MNTPLRETPLRFACQGESLIGICSEPPEAAAQLGVLIIVGGPQYRAGSHRQFTLLSRALAHAGYAAMRFDYRGMGDSGGVSVSVSASVSVSVSAAPISPSYADIDADIAAALDAMQTVVPSLQRFVLWGLCDGASAALLYAQRSADPRIAGLALANPWLHDEQAEAHAIVHTYYRQRFLDAAFWRKLLSGGINPFGKLRELGGQWRKANTEAATDETSLLLNALNGLRLPMLILLCKRDATAQEFLAQLTLAQSPVLQQAHVRRIDFDVADHTFSRAEWRREVENVTIDWLNSGSLNSTTTLR